MGRPEPAGKGLVNLLQALEDILHFWWESFSHVGEFATAVRHILGGR